MTVMVSGGFDPVHVGHLDMLEEASLYGPVIVALNSDAWLLRKKGYCFMKYAERERLLKAIYCVMGVIPVDDSDGTVCEALRREKPQFFANGGDRNSPNRDEANVCQELGIVQIFGVGGGKTQSSSQLVERLRSRI